MTHVLALSRQCDVCPHYTGLISQMPTGIYCLPCLLESDWWQRFATSDQQLYLRSTQSTFFMHFKHMIGTRVRHTCLPLDLSIVSRVWTSMANSPNIVKCPCGCVN